MPTSEGKYFRSCSYMRFIVFVYRLASLDSQPTHTVASCLDLTTSLAKFTPALVIENLSQHFLPVIVSTGNDVIRKPWEAEIERSWLGHLIDVECSQSRWDSHNIFFSTNCRLFGYLSDVFDTTWGTIMNINYIIQCLISKCLHDDFTLIMYHLFIVFLSQWF